MKTFNILYQDLSAWHNKLCRIFFIECLEKYGTNKQATQTKTAQLQNMTQIFFISLQDGNIKINNNANKGTLNSNRYQKKRSEQKKINKEIKKVWFM